MLPILLLLGSLISLTSGAALAKSLFLVAGPAGVTMIRVGIGALIVGLFWRPWRFRIGRQQFKILVLFGICLGIMNLLFYYAIARLPIGLAIAIEFLGPLSIALFYSKRKMDGLWVFLAAMGIVLILPIADFSADLDIVGVFFALGAAACWALYIVLGKRAGKGTHSGVATSIGMFVAFLSVTPFGIGSVSPLFSSQYIYLAMAVGLLSSAIPYSLEMVALKSIPEKHFGLLLSLEPMIGALMGFIFLGESLSLVQYVAMACIIAASVGSSCTQRSPLEPTPQ